MVEHFKALYKIIDGITQRMKYSGQFRAKVTETDIDGNDYGQVRVFIPHIMTTKDPNYDEDRMGIIANPANNSVGGRNTSDTKKDSYYQGQVIVPPLGSWIWVFFENCDPNKPFYMAALDLSGSKVPPENRNVEEPNKVYTILKTHEGRTLVLADSPDVQRVEITGKKRNLSGEDPAGNADSTYTIDDNQTTILFDEREGKEKILIRSYKGDYLHFDIDEQKLHGHFADDIVLKSDKNVSFEAGEEIILKATGKLSAESGANVVIKSGAKASIESTGDTNIKGVNVNVEASAQLSNKSGGVNAIDGSLVSVQNGSSSSASPGVPGTPKVPEGERDT